VVKKLKAARKRKKASGKGRYTGRKSHLEKRPDVVAEAKRLYRVNPKTGDRRSLREVCAELEFAGYFDDSGRPYHPQSIQRMIVGERSARAIGKS